MPGILAGLIGALMAGIATENDYHTKLYQVFPARAPTDPGLQHPLLTPGDGRTAIQQAGYQILAIVLTLITSIISGLITGKVLRHEKADVLVVNGCRIISRTRCSDKEVVLLRCTSSERLENEWIGSVFKVPLGQILDSEFRRQTCRLTMSR